MLTRFRAEQPPIFPLPSAQEPIQRGGGAEAPEAPINLQRRLELALVILTGVLAITTAVYAWYTRAMLRLSVRPKIALVIDPVGPNAVFVALRSLGHGPALDIEVELTFDPPGERRQWRNEALAPGQQARFIPPEVEGKHLIDLKALSGLDVHVRLRGTVKDLLGKTHSADDDLALGEWARVVEESGQEYFQEPLERSLRELERIRKALERNASTTTTAHRIGGSPPSA